jgi:hypothetical protein
MKTTVHFLSHLTILLRMRIFLTATLNIIISAKTAKKQDTERSKVWNWKKIIVWIKILLCSFLQSILAPVQLRTAVPALSRQDWQNSTNIFGYNNLSTQKDSNSEPHEHKIGVSTTTLQHSLHSSRSWGWVSFGRNQQNVSVLTSGSQLRMSSAKSVSSGPV